MPDTLMRIKRYLSRLRLLLGMGGERSASMNENLDIRPRLAAGDTMKAEGAFWTLTGQNAGTVTNLTGSFAGMANLIDTSGGTLRAAGATWTLTGPDSGTVTNLTGSFAGMANLNDTRGGALKAPGTTWTLTGTDSGTVTNLTGSFAGMKLLTGDGRGKGNG